MLVASTSSMTAMDRALAVVNSGESSCCPDGPESPNDPPTDFPTDLASLRRDLQPKFRIMSRDDTLLAVTRSSCSHDTRNSRDMVDGLIHAGDTILLRLPIGDIKSFKLEADSYVAFRIVPLIKRLTPKQNCESGKVWFFSSGCACEPAVRADVRGCQ